MSDCICFTDPPLTLPNCPVHGRSAPMPDPTGARPSEREPYRVEVEREECAKCKTGTLYTVEGPNGVCIGQSFYDRVDAEECAVELNGVHERAESRLAARVRAAAEAVLKQRGEGFDSVQFVADDADDDLAATFARALLAMLDALPPPQEGEHGE